MAPKWNLLIGSILLAGHTVAEDDFEVFPLSGGIDNGVTVTIDVTGFNYDNAKIEFLKPNREVAFGLAFDGSQITRSWKLGDKEGSHTYGGWPEDLPTDGQKAASLQFTKRSKKWALTIGGVRYPWFDFEHKHDESTDLLTHVRVYSGMSSAEVTLERKECSEKCHPDECNSDSFNATYPTHVVTKTGDCIDSKETTPDEGQHCCDGEEAVLALTEGLKGKFVRVHETQANVVKVCTAFGLNCANADFSSKKVRVEGVDEAEAKVSVFVPFAQDSRIVPTGDPPTYPLPDTVKFDFPAYALKMSNGTDQKLSHLKPNPFPQGQPKRPDPHTEVIVEGDANGILPKGYFVNLVRIRFNDPDGNPERRWTKYNTFALSQITSRVQDELYMHVSDEPIEDMGACADSDINGQTWVDANGDDCGNYTSGDWCNEHGEVLDNGKARFGDDFPDGATGNVPYFRANFQCCHCGGGSHPAPEDAPQTLATAETILE